ncbi:MAG: hypothetical protein AB7T37_14300 [Dehalococcoidia bacterium]
MAVRMGSPWCISGPTHISRFAIDAGDKEPAEPPTRDFMLVSPSGARESSVVRAFREFTLGREWLAARGLSELAGGEGPLVR